MALGKFLHLGLFPVKFLFRIVQDDTGGLTRTSGATLCSKCLCFALTCALGCGIEASAGLTEGMDILLGGCRWKSKVAGH